MEIPPYKIISCAVVVFWMVMVTAAGFPITMPLERVVPATKVSDLSHLLAHDRARHGRLLEQYGVNIPVQGNVDQYGIYYIRVQIGSPPKNFYVLIDTGSDISWISCSSCSDCPKYTNVPIQLSFYDPNNSSSASLIPCWDHKCKIALGTSESGCSAQTSQCGYKLSYEDSATTSDFFVSDLLHLESNVSNTSTTIYSTHIFLGCSTTRVESLTSVNIVDGIFGFGQGGSSIISQLAGMTPKIFAHCLRGDNVGGGSLIIGKIIQPNITYTPLIPLQQYYSIQLQSISVNGQLLDINSSVFDQSNNQGAIVDSGTTLAYLPEAAFIPFINTITAVVSRFAQPYLLGDIQCYVVNSSNIDTFPKVNLNFVGNASLILSPRDYLQKFPSDSSTRWCIGIQKSQDHEIILGDIVMKDKLIIYDLESQKIGWLNYDCLLPVLVSGIHRMRGRTNKSSPHTLLYWLIFSSIMIILGIIVVASLLLLWHRFTNQLKKIKDLLGLRFRTF